MGAYVARTSSLNDKHSCQLFRMGLRDKTTPTLTTPLIGANKSALATIFSSLTFLSSSISMANLSQPFGSCIILQSCSSFLLQLATTFSSLSFLSNSLSSPRFNLLRVARRIFLWFSVFLFSRLILSLSFLCLQSLKLCLL